MEPRTAAERIERGVVLLALGAAALAITSFAAGTLLTREASLSKAPATVPAAPLFDAPASRPVWPPARKDDSLSLVRASFAAKAAVAPPASVPPRRREPAPPAKRPPAAEPRRRSEAQSTHKSLPSLTKTALETPSSGSRGSPFSATTIASTSSAASRPPVASGGGSSQRVARASPSSHSRAAARALTKTSAAGSRQAGGDFPDYASAGAPGSQAAADSISSSSASAAEVAGLAAGTDGKSVPANASGNGTGNSDKLPDTRSGKGDDAQFVSQTAPPATVVAGETFNVGVTMLNVGSSTWTWVSDYKLGSENPASNSKWGVSAVWLDAVDSILPGQQKVFSFPVTAPTTPGTYPFQWRMARGSGGWFGDYTDGVTITVTAAP